ncbi:hypothetical protein M153_618000935 [Pseudoloma neurophilia]|uniref:Uncharacterized protein n=1 Tax=Pseudoloma neurophilia TaxID=146866 RepID=A0A0R0M3V2_9MICR|nr:hypothetical protein M153_618000935 [Pseudoloma neurophilia]
MTMFIVFNLLLILEYFVNHALCQNDTIVKPRRVEDKKQKTKPFGSSHDKKSKESKELREHEKWKKAQKKRETMSDEQLQKMDEKDQKEIINRYTNIGKISFKSYLSNKLDNLKRKFQASDDEKYELLE